MSIVSSSNISRPRNSHAENLWRLLIRRIAALQRYYNRRTAAKREEIPIC
jgi:hypothetical protein